MAALGGAGGGGRTISKEDQVSAGGEVTAMVDVTGLGGYIMRFYSDFHPAPTSAQVDTGDLFPDDRARINPDWNTVSSLHPSYGSSHHRCSDV